MSDPSQSDLFSFCVFGTAQSFERKGESVRVRG
jgi:hypothetical protein